MNQSNMQLNTDGSGNFSIGNGSNVLSILASGYSVTAGSLGIFGFSATPGSNSSPADTGISRDSAGVLDVGNGTQGDRSGTVKAAIFNSTVATGTAPLTVASTTQVANLNAATAGAATNMAGGAAGEVPYQTGAGASGFTAAGTSKQIMVSGGTGSPVWIDFPERLMVPAANCNNTTAGAGWSIGSGGTVTCRAGTNNLGGYISITDTSSTFAQFQLSIPTDWDTATDPYILFGLISVTDTTSGHTIIPQIKVSCPTATNGTVTDDHAFAAAHSATTITMGGSAVANGFYTTSVQMNSTDMTGCVAGGMMIVQVGRATDTATGTIGFEYANVTIPRLVAVQAN